MEELLVMKDICKSFGPVKASDHVSLHVQRGEIHALIGENGAGKTTLMRILFGIEARDSGVIEFDGEVLEFDGPQMAMKKGIGMVHQHFMLVPSLTVAENVILGQEPTRKLSIDRAAARQKVNDIAQKYNLQVDPDVQIRNCPVGIQQRVEIIKALSKGANLLILDEPTAVLTPQEANELFSILRAMKEDGKTIIFISHKLKEVLEISDRITVMRQGKVVSTLNTNETNEQELATHMVGRDVLLRVQKEPAKPTDHVLEVKKLHVRNSRGLPAIKDVSFAIRKGEILGIAGVEGNGQSELVEALTGLHPGFGEVIKNHSNLLNQPVQHIRKMGVVHIPEDRFLRGLCPDASILENIIGGYHTHKDFQEASGISWKKAEAFARKLVEDYKIKIGSLSDPVKSLSGGNAQKVVIARELSFQCDCVIASQPTRGVDIGAIEFIHQTLIKKRDEGAGILLVSADLQEILSLSDRILVLYEGEIMGEFQGSETNEEELGLYMTGVRRQEVQSVV